MDESRPGAGERPLKPVLVIALGLALGPAAVLGLARFGYALLLPPMRSWLHWSFATAGLMNTANAVGYLAGALGVGWLGRRFGARLAFLGGITVTGLALLASAATAAVVPLTALRLIAGAGGALTFVIGGGLAAQAGHGLRATRAALVLGVYFGGPALGVLVSALVVGPLLAAVGDAGWRWGWLALGGLTILALAGALPASRRAALPPPAPPGERLARRPLTAMAAGYTLFGVGYIAYMTFIVAYLRQQGASDEVRTMFWAVLGACGVAGGFLWGPLLGRLRGGRGPAMVMAVVAAGAALPLVGSPSSLGAAFASAVLFGGSFLAVVTAVTAVARVSLPPTQWTPAIGYLTMLFAAGQCLGPVLAGAVSDGLGGVRSGMLASVAVLAFGAVVALAQPHRVLDPGEQLIR